MILLYNKHYGSSPSLRRVAQILESNCLQTLGGRVGEGGPRHGSLKPVKRNHEMTKKKRRRN